MPVFRLTVEKFHPQSNEYWTNVYHVNATDGQDTLPITDAIVSAERPVLGTQFTLTKVSISQPGLGSGAVLGANIYNLQGTLNLPAPLPLFVVARIDFSVPNSRPARKYLRGCMDEALANFNAIEPGFMSNLQSYANAIVAVPGICDPDGQPLVSGAPKANIAMRQLRRGAKKKPTPSTPT